MQAKTAVIMVLGLAALADPAAAQDARERARLGYELALYGRMTADLRGELRVSGSTYEVRGLADLRAMPRATVETVLTRARTVRNRTTREAVGRASVTSDGQGRFQLEVPVPAEPMPSPLLEITVRRGNDVGRTWEYAVGMTSPLQLELLSDRNLYERGETVHGWARLTDRGSPGEPSSVDRESSSDRGR